MLWRTAGFRELYVLNLTPGHTGLPRLDNIAFQYSWSKFLKSPSLRYRPLADITSDGLWFYRVVHGCAPRDLASPTIWDIADRAWTAQKASQAFSVTVPLTAMGDCRFSPLVSRSATFILLVHTGSGTDAGEFWLDYSVEFGGVSALRARSSAVTCRDGNFYHTDGKKALGGVPVIGSSTSYKFFPPMPLNMLRDFSESIKGYPTHIRRPDDSEPVIDNTSTAEQIIVDHPPADSSWSFSKYLPTVDTVVNAMLDAYDVARALPWRRIRHAIIPTSVRNPVVETSADISFRSVLAGWSGRGNTGPLTPRPFLYTGLVVVEDGPSQRLSFLNAPSLPPLVAASTAVTLDGVGRQVLARTFRADSPVRTYMNPQHVRAITDLTTRADDIIHSGADVISVLGGTSGTLDDGGGSSEGVNPLPEIPDFGGDPLAPGATVAWATTLRYFTGHVTDDNGTAVVKFLAGWPSAGLMHISPPTPVNYWEIRKSWDQETKRTLGAYVNVSEKLAGHYLVLQGATWTDDACVCWWPSVDGATYMGTVTLFGAITVSRSVLYVYDTDKFNDSEINLSIGQSKHRIMSGEQGRSCQFTVMLGAVADYDIARNFLESWAKLKPLKNQRWWKGEGTRDSDYGFAYDFALNKTRSSLPVGLEPFTPGFDENYQAYMSAKANGITARSLPVVIEAGPFFLAYGCRVDEENGWYQYAPYFTYSKTDISAQWGVQFRFGCEGSTNEFRHSDETWCGKSSAAMITLPEALVSGAKYCVESYGMNADVTSNGDGVTSSSTQQPWDQGTNTKWDVLIPGPLAVGRWTGDATDRKILVNSSGLHERSCDAIPGNNRDLFHHGLHVFYLLKGSEAANRWSRFDMCADGSTEVSLGEVVKTSGETYMLAKLNSIGPSGARNWNFTGVKWPTSYLSFKRSSAPCADPCPIWRGHSGSRAVPKDELRYSASQPKPADAVSGSPPVMGPSPPDLTVPSQPTPEGFQGAVQVVNPIVPNIPSTVTTTKPGVDFAITTIHSAPSLNRAAFEASGSTGTYGSSAVHDAFKYNRMVSCNLDWNDGSTVMPYTQMVAGSDYGTTSDSADIVQVPVAVPDVPGAGDTPLTIFMAMHASTISWTSGTDPELDYTSDYKGVQFFGGKLGGPSGNSSYANIAKAYGSLRAGHTHAFRLRRCQLFTSKVIHQTPPATGLESGDVYYVQRCPNLVVIALQVDMADPAAQYDRFITGYLIPAASCSAKYQINVSSMKIYTTFLDYEKALCDFRAHLPDILEFRGRLKGVLSLQTYLEEDPKPMLGFTGGEPTVDDTTSA